MLDRNNIAAGLRFLVVDDHFFMASLVRDILRGLGAKSVELAPNGVVAMDRLNNQVFDLVICDIAMKPFNGLQLLAAIRAGLALEDKHLPVIMLTGHTDKEMVESAKALGADGFLAKPTSMKDLAAKIEHVIFNRRPGTLPSLDKDQIAAALAAAKQEHAEAEADLRYIGHTYKTKKKREDAAAGGRRAFTHIASEGLSISRGIDEVRPGEVLADDVVARDGRKMLSKGLQLTNAKVMLLRKHGREYGIDKVRVFEGIDDDLEGDMPIDNGSMDLPRMA
jgi:CheY-like chemotaxis protein